MPFPIEQMMMVRKMVTVNDFLSPPVMVDAKSEPHSHEVTYLYNVLSANFPNDRVFWDLHHYFLFDKTEDNRRFDLSWFQNMDVPAEQACYKAWEHDNRVPDLVINVLSVSTWMKDLSDIVEFCRAIKIPYYIVFAPYHVASRMYLPPFLRVYRLIEDQYEQEERHECVTHEGQTDWNENELITLEEGIPFRIGLEQLKVVQGKGNPRYRLILVSPNEPRILPTNSDRFLQEKDQALQLLLEKDKEIQILKEKLEHFKEDN